MQKVLNSIPKLLFMNICCIEKEFVVKKDSSLKELRVYHCKIDSRSFDHCDRLEKLTIKGSPDLCDHIEMTHQLSQLKISDSRFGVAFVLKLSQLSLASLTIKNQKYNRHGKSIVEEIGKMSTLKRLNLKENYFEFQEKFELCHSLSKLNLISLNIQGCLLDCKHCELLFDSIRHMTALEKLGISKNYVMVESQKKLATFFRTLTRLKCLDMHDVSHMSYSQDGLCKDLLESMSCLTRLQSLSIGKNLFSSVDALSNSIRNMNLCVFEMYDSRLDAPSMIALCRGLRKSRLKILLLGGNDFGNVGMHHILENVQCAHLEKLDLQQCDMSDESDFADFVRASSNLRELVIGNRFESCKKILDSVCTLSLLEKLFFTEFDKEPFARHLRIASRRLKWIEVHDFRMSEDDLDQMVLHLNQFKIERIALPITHSRELEKWKCRRPKLCIEEITMFRNGV